MMRFEDFKIQLLNIVRNDSIETVKEFMDSFFINISIPIVEVNRPFVVRARINKSGEVFRSKSQLAYNPDCKSISLQRANFKGQQLFYASVPSESEFSDCLSTALAEVAMEYVKDESFHREYFTVGRWRVNRSLKVAMLPFSKRCIDLNKDFSEAYKIHNSILDNYFNNVNNVNTVSKDIHLSALEFISDTFCQGDEKDIYYKISASYFNLISNYFKYNGYDFDGLIYPSSNTLAAGMNIALLKDLADDGTLTLDYVIMNVMQRNPSNPNDIWFVQGSSEAIPDSIGDFFINHIY